MVHEREKYLSIDIQRNSTCHAQRTTSEAAAFADRGRQKFFARQNILNVTSSSSDNTAIKTSPSTTVFIEENAKVNVGHHCV